MQDLFSPEQRRDFLRRGFTRRDFGRLAAFVTAGAALPFYNEATLAQGLSAGPRIPADAVKINANENPMGPCPEAIEAIQKLVPLGGRYLYEQTFHFIDAMAEIEGVSRDHVLPFAGSSDPLHRVVLAYCGPEKSFVVADPGYEAGGKAAEFVGARTIKVPLRKDWSHDVRAMAAADPNAGVIYVCNPNNPTGSITPKDEIEYLVANKPKGAIVLLDEAYIHLSKTAEPGSPMVAAGKDVIVLRTFSKLYGMAGPAGRCGAGASRPAGEDPPLRRRGVAGHRHGRRDRQPQGQGPGRVAAQGHRRHPRGDGRLAGEEGIRRDPLRGEHDHDRHPPARPRGLPGHDAGEGGDRADLVGLAQSRAGHDRHARRRWRSSGRRSGTS